MQDIRIHICQSYPINILYNLFYPSFILRIQVQYPGNISLMLSNYNILILSKYVHLYPIMISVSDILDVILFGYPVQVTVILSYLNSCPFISS